MDFLGFNLKILAHNVNGWNNRKFHLFNCYKEVDPDLILINEHGVPDSENIKVYGYEVIQKNPTQHRFDGVAIAVKRGLKFKRGQELEEGYLSVVLETSLGPVEIATGYQPPRRGYLPNHSLIQLFSKPHPVIFMGDLNANTAISGYRSLNGAGRSLNALIDRGVTQRIGPSFPTFYSPTTSTKPDIVLINRVVTYNYFITEGPVTTSDHIPILMRISTAPIQVEIPKRKSLRKADWEKYREILMTHHQDLKDGDTLEDIDQAVERMQNVIIRADEEVVPKIKHKIIPYPANTPEVVDGFSLLRELFSAARREGMTPPLFRRIQAAKAELTRSLQRMQNQKWNQIISELDTEVNPSVFWNTIKRLKGETTKKKKITLKGRNGATIEDSRDIEKAFKEKWEKVFRISEDDDELFDHDHENMVRDWLVPRVDRIVPFDVIDNDRFNDLNPKVTYEELMSAIKETKQRAPGLSGITKRHLMEAPKKTIEQILNIFNACFNTGYYPDGYKLAKMIFIPKPGKPPNQVANFRPISLLDYIGKLLERIINKRIVTHLTTYNLYNPAQHGFRKARGTDTALAFLTEYMALRKGQKCSIDLAMRDIEKAFDKVWVTGLQYKILNLNLPTLTEKITTDYLMERRALISIEGFDGAPFALLAGVPQGGCLSPTLFSIYTSDIPPPLRLTDKDIYYADDVNQLITDETKSVRYMALYTGREINRINKFEKKWKIKNNITKTKIIPISRRKTDDVITEDQEFYEYTSEGKVLGLTITSNGYTKHYKTQILRSQNELRKLRRFRNLSLKNKRKLYLTLIRPILTYPIIPTVSASTSRMRNFQSVQNRAVRWITGTYERTQNIIQELHRNLKLPTINTYLHSRAKKIWEKLEVELDEELFGQLTRPPEHFIEHNNFRRSYSRTQDPVRPIFL